MTYQLPDLPYGYGDLEPAISKDIMKLHHQKHHQAYVDKLNDALKGLSLKHSDLNQILANLDELPQEIRTVVKNNGGGHYNHSLFWQCMSPAGGSKPSGELLYQIEDKYGSFEKFVDKFTTKSKGLFGSGWVWLMPDMDIITTPNQDNPMMSSGGEPLLGLDVWEHA